MEWDAASVGRYFEAGGAAEAAGVAGQEGLVGYVVLNLEKCLLTSLGITIFKQGRYF